MAARTIEIDGHIVDSLLLAKILDAIVDAGADYEITEFDLGRTSTDPSHAVIELRGDHDTVERLVTDLQIHGANPTDDDDAEVVVTDRDGVLPAGFYSTTNLATEVRLDRTWRSVENPEMDCGIVVTDAAVRTVPMHRIRSGDRVVVGTVGVRVEAPDRSVAGTSFEFMNSDVSSEKPKTLLIARVAERIRAAHDAERQVLLVAGPAVIHAGAGPAVARLVEDGWIDVLFAGNGFATHDIESNVLGTSLGVSVSSGARTEGGHSNHVRVINEVRRHGSIAAAVEARYVTGGVMKACIDGGIPFVLAGSVRDDGPLPDTITDVTVAADAMRSHVSGVGVALTMATTLHAIATGNILPSGVETFCVDINQAVVTKLADRGSHQALGIVTDVGVFVERLVAELGAT